MIRLRLPGYEIKKLVEEKNDGFVTFKKNQSIAKSDGIKTGDEIKKMLLVLCC